MTRRALRLLIVSALMAGALVPVGQAASAAATPDRPRAVAAVEESSSAIAYTWGRFRSTIAYGGSYVLASQPGAKARFRFRGDSITWYFTGGRDQGLADVYIDNVRVARVSAYRDQDRVTRNSRTFRGLGSGSHSIVIVARGPARPSQTNGWTTIDAFKAGGKLHETPALDTWWSKASSSGASGGRVVRARDGNTTATWRFTGRGVDWVTETGPNQGYAYVYIDGKKVATVDNYAPVRRAGVVRRFDKLLEGSHTIVVRAAGTRRTASSDTIVTVDRFVSRRPNIVAFGGLGAWVDLWDKAIAPAGAVADMKARGVRTLWLQTGRYNNDAFVTDRAWIDGWVDAARGAGLRVVGWYLPGYADIARDVERTMKVVTYVSPGGHRFDGLGIDIEYRAEVDHDTGRFNRGVVEHLKKVRYRSGGLYPIAAITPPANQMELAPSSWAGFPWTEIGRRSDVLTLMIYWAPYRHDRCDAGESQYCAYRYTGDAVRLGRASTGLPIHVIGGEAGPARPGEIGDFCRAAREGRAYGWGVYDYGTTSAQSWEELNACSRS